MKFIFPCYGTPTQQTPSLKIKIQKRLKVKIKKRFVPQPSLMAYRTNKKLLFRAATQSFKQSHLIKKLDEEISRLVNQACLDKARAYFTIRG